MSAEESAPPVVEHWLDLARDGLEIKKISYVAKLASGHTPSRQREDYWVDCTIPWISLGDVWRFRHDRVSEIFETKEKISAAGLANSAAELLPRGTVCLSRTASVGFSVITGENMATTQDFANWICGPALLPKFLLHSLRAMRPDFERLKTGSTHNTIYMPDIGMLRLAVPAIETQRRAVELIERETAHIDTLIDKQKKLIELLKKKRQAVISQAVAKGLDPDVPMKDSEEEWLGEIPNRWSAVRLKHIGIIIDCKHVTVKFVDEGFPLASIAEAKEWHVDLSSAKRCSEEQYLDLISGGRKPEVGDVVLTRNATVGETALVGRETPLFALGQDVCLIKPASQKVVFRILDVCTSVCRCAASARSEHDRLYVQEG